MWAAAYGRGDPSALRERLLRLGCSASAGVPKEHAGERGVLMAWAGASLDASTAWLGDLRGRVDESGTARGCFAAARLEGGRLHLACGRSGGRPLYVAWEDEGAMLVACTRLAPLLSSMGHRPPLRADRLLERLADIPGADLHATHYDDVQRVGSGEQVVLSVAPSGEVEPTVSGLGTLGLGEPIHASPDETADGLRAVIETAVARAAAGAKRVAILGGGGVDSSAILASAVAAARGAGDKDVRAITQDIGGFGDDRPYVRALCRELGIVPIYVPGRAAARHFVDDVITDASPAYTWHFAWLHGAMRLAREDGADVVLSGVGGDELFDGDFDVFAARARGGDVLGAVSSAIRLRAVYWLPRARDRLDHLILRPLLRGALPPSALARARHLRSRLLRRGRPRWHGAALEEFVARGTPQGEDSGREMLMERALERAQAEITAGCPRVDPLLDDDVVDYASRIPRELLFHGNIRRGLFRHAFRGVVPDEVRLRADKSVATEGFGEVVNERGLAMLRELSTMRELSARGLVDARGFAADFHEASKSDDPRVWRLLWTPLALEALLRAQGSS